jgi:hypothetical protein
MATVAICLACLTDPCAAQGRAYIEMERKIVKMTKQMVEEEREVKAFGKLLEEMDAADTSESTRGFWQVAQRVSEAMQRELDQGLERLEKEDGADVLKTIEAPDTSAADSPMLKRLRRMRAIVTESDGLRSPLAMADPATMTRYRALAGEFQELMATGIKAMKADIESLKSKQRAAGR